MLGIVKNNQIIPLTTDTGTGAPIGTLIQQYKKVAMSGYLYCDGSTFDENVYPALYMYLGTNVLPDYRECVMVGAEQNTTDTIAAHDVYGEGEFKDDQLQDHGHRAVMSRYGTGSGSLNGVAIANYQDNLVTDVVDGRRGDTTHGKQKAVYVYIKATSGIMENAQDNVLRDVKDYVDGKTLYNKVTKDLGIGWNYIQKFEGLKAGTYVITTTIDATVNDINVVIDGVFTQIGTAGYKNGTLVIDIANDGTDMTIAVYTNTATTGVTLRTVLMKVA